MDSILTPTIVDWLCIAIALLAPIWLVLRYEIIGVITGTLIAWFSLIVAGIVLSELDPEREGGIADGIWLLFGWIGGLLYCLLILIFKRIVDSMYRLNQSGPVESK